MEQKKKGSQKWAITYRYIKLVGGIMEHIKMILFDLDDTLVHFDDYWEISVKEAFINHSFTKDLDSNILFEIFNTVDRHLVQKLDSQQISINEYRVQRFLNSMEQVGRKPNIEMANDFERFYQSIGKKNMKPNFSVNGLIEELKDYYQIGVLTNGSKGWQLDKLEAIGLNAIFSKDYVFISEDIGYEKPSREIYHHVLKTVSLKPYQVLVVGDSWTNDVVGPIQQGMQAIWLNKKKIKPPLEPSPLATINHLLELREILLLPFLRNQASVEKAKNH